MFDLPPADAGSTQPRAVSRRGWAAIPVRERVVELQDLNATGRSKLTFRYRPLRTWIPARLDVVEFLLVEYFRLFGMFRLVDQAVMRAWYEGVWGLADSADPLFSAEEVHWAMTAKMASLQGDSAEETRSNRAAFTARPESFPRTIAYWLEHSPQWRAQNQAAREGAERAKLNAALGDLIRQGAERDRLLAAGEFDELERRRLARQAEMLRTQEQINEREHAEWTALNPQKRTAAISAVRRQFADYVSRDRQHPNPEDPYWDALLTSWALSWARQQWPQPQAKQEVPQCSR